MFFPTAYRSGVLVIRNDRLSLALISFWHAESGADGGEEAAYSACDEIFAGFFFFLHKFRNI
jgi:hypothetical protein